jgi:hypothetical protein
MLNKAEKSKCVNDDTLCTVISGSFRKHLHKIIQLKKELEKNHVAVLSPAGNIAVNPEEEFIVLDSDPVTHPKLLQDSVFAKIRRSTFLVVANFDGYLGRAAVLEIGYALAIGITVYVIEPVEDPNLKPYCHLLSEVFPNVKHCKEEQKNNVSKTLEKPYNPHASLFTITQKMTSQFVACVLNKE